MMKEIETHKRRKKSVKFQEKKKMRKEEIEKGRD